MHLGRCGVSLTPYMSISYSGYYGALPRLGRVFDSPYRLTKTIMSKYYHIEERNGHEGEEWSFFIPKKGNEAFIKKLKSTIKKFEEDEEEMENWISILSDISESAVDILVSNTKSGYMDYNNKIDRILSPDLINGSNIDSFIESFYKGKLFK